MKSKPDATDDLPTVADCLSDCSSGARDPADQHTALILVDLQNDFLPGGSLAVPEGDRVLEVANRMMQLFSFVVATQDWHPPDHSSFAVHHQLPVGTQIALDGLAQVLWPVHCVQGTRGAYLSNALHNHHISTIVTKGTDKNIDSYSGFFDNGHRRQTRLAEVLQQRGVTDLYIMGLATDYCVKYTALDARQLGFNTFLITDGCRGVNIAPSDTDNALREMKAADVRLVASR